MLASGDKVPREALLICWNRDDGKAYKAVVSLDENRVVSWEHRPDEQPNVTVDEYHECDVTLRRDPKVVEALAARGVTDMDKVLFDVWAYGGSLIADKYRGRRIGWTDIWYRDHEDSNPYANPVNGLKLVVDLNSVELLEIEDTFTVEKPKIMGEYVPKHVPGLRERGDLKPLEITQPEGTSFVLNGNELRWQKWSMRIGFNYREGLVLHTVGYDDGGKTRPVAHRMSFSEMVVPYGIPVPNTSGAQPSTSASGGSGS